MPRPWKHVHRLGAVKPVTAFAEDADVAGEGGRIAGNVDDARRRSEQQCAKQLFIRAFAGRVEDDCVKALATGDAAWNFTGGIGADKAGAAVHAVAAGILDCVGDGRRDDFDAEHIARALRRSQRDRSHAAIGVEHTHLYIPRRRPSGWQGRIPHFDPVWGTAYPASGWWDMRTLASLADVRPAGRDESSFPGSVRDAAHPASGW